MAINTTTFIQATDTIQTNAKLSLSDQKSLQMRQDSPFHFNDKFGMKGESKQYWWQQLRG
jgi:hypothetical protein